MEPMAHGVSRREFIRLGVISVAGLNFIAASCAPSTIPTASPVSPTQAPAQGPTPVPPAKLEQVLFALDWVVYGRHAGYFVALDKGYYTEQNLSVSIVRGYGSADSIKRIAAGQGQFSFGDMGSLVLARANDNVKVKVVCMVYSRAPHTIYFFEDSGIKQPKDLEGKKIGAPAGDAIRTLFPAFAKANNVDETKVQWVTIDAASKLPLFLSGQTDATTEFIMATPLIQKQAKDRKVKWFHFPEYGLDFYSNGIMVTEDYLRQKPDVVKRFVAATIEGWRYAFDHPDEAIAILRKYHPEVEADIGVQEIGIVKDLVLSDEAKKNGIGYMDSGKVAVTRDLMATYFQLKGQVKPEDLYTNDFLPKGS